MEGVVVPVMFDVHFCLAKEFVVIMPPVILNLMYQDTMIDKPGSNSSNTNT